MTYGSRNDKRSRRESHHRASRLRSSRGEALLSTMARFATVDDTAKQEAHAHDQEQVG